MTLNGLPLQTHVWPQMSSRSSVINQDGDCAPILRVLLYLLALVGKASQAMLGEVLKDFG